MNEWTELNGGLERQFVFADFQQAWAFMNKVAVLAEKANHHPEWSNVYNRVKIRLSTHDAGGVVTNNDREMAKEINQLKTI